MNKLLKTILFLTLTLLFFGFGNNAMASNSITNIEISELKNNKALLTWATYYAPTKGIVYYGKEASKLDRSVIYGSYTMTHEIYLNGLEDDEDYYFKIVAADKSQSLIETYIMHFATEDILDTQAPEIDNEQVMQSTADAVYIKWTTDEETKAVVHYGTDVENLNKKYNYRSFDKEHELFIYKLESDKYYYLQIIAYDRDDNKTSSKLLRFNTNSDTNKNTELNIYDIKPKYSDANMIFSNRVIISWRTNFAAQAYVYYGTSPDKLKKKVKVTDGEHLLKFEQVITDLEPNTTYYYVIKAYDSLYKKKAESNIGSFVTKADAKNITVSLNQNTKKFDSDYDGLDDEYELKIGIDPYNYDTDGDGYADGVEILNGYDPNGLGKLVKEVFAYGKERLDHVIEDLKARDLRAELEQKLGDLNIDLNYWFKLVNAYVYGDYTVDSIAQAVKYGGKTVHPDIDWQSWRSSSDYLNFINK